MNSTDASRLRTNTSMTAKTIAKVAQKMDHRSAS